MVKFIVSVLSEENGMPSSKRVCGFLIILAAIIAAMYFSFKFGLTQNVLTLWQTLVTMGGTLVGLSSITNIWSGNKSSSQD